MAGADSAGLPWEGRSFSANPHGADDGAAPAHLIDAIRRFREGTADESAVVDALRDARLLIPLVAELGDEGVGAHGLVVDKSQELSIVTVESPDGRAVIPAFSSVEAMSRWNPSARPVPVDAVRVALAAADEGTELVVLDPTSDTEFALRRPAVWALAQQKPWRPSHTDPDVRIAFERSIAAEGSVVGVRLASADPEARLAAAELRVELSVAAGLDRAELGALIERLARAWAADELIAERVDSMRVAILPAG